MPGINVGLLDSITSVAGSEGQILVNSQFLAVQGGTITLTLDRSLTGATGLATLLTDMSGQLVSQIQSAAGVLSLNGVTGLLTIGGTNGNQVSVSGLTIWVSGSSGYAAAVYATIANLVSSGRRAWNDATNLSGVTFDTGVAAMAYTDTRAAVSGLAGVNYTDTRVAVSGLAGVNYTDARTAATGLAGVNYTDSRVAVSGQAGVNYTNARTETTGGAAVAYTDTRIINASGGQIVYTTGTQTISGPKTFTAVVNVQANLTSSGLYIYPQLTGDYSINSGAVSHAQLRAVSGILNADIEVSSVGVTTINGLSGVLVLGGIGNIGISPSGQTIYVSGQDLATDSELASTGQAAVNYTDSRVATSGQAGVNYTDTRIVNASGGQIVYTTGTQTIVGLKTFTLVVNVQNNTTSSGVYIYPQLTGDYTIRSGVASVAQIYDVSGYGSSIYATIVNLNSSGRRAWDDATNLSGVVFNTGVAAMAYTDTRVAATGQAAWQVAHNNAVNLSGNAGATGAYLIQRDLDISGSLQTNIDNNVTAFRFAVLNVTGNFDITGDGTYGYSWSGALQSEFTGTLSLPATMSGYQILLKNRSTGAYLLVSGSVDYDTNYTLGPKAAVRLWSDNATFLIV